MEFIDLGAQQRLIREKIENNIKKVLDHGKYIMGPEVKELEEKLAEYVGVKYAISCASGTDALLMSLMAYRIKAGDYIITTPFTFIATAEVISLLGAIPVFVDIGEETYNIDPEKIKEFLKNPVDRRTNKKIEYSQIKGIIPVDIFGLPADYDEINKIAREYNLFVIEDAAQSFGAEYKGKKACALADIGCTSFFPAKPLGCYGDGGMIFTENEEICDILKSIRVHGQGSNKYDNVRIGINGRLDTIQAAILLAKFEIFPEEVVKRHEVAQRYNEALADKFYLQEVPSGYLSVWAQYSIRPKIINKTREEYMKMLNGNKIPSVIYYKKPLHLQEVYIKLGYNDRDFPICEALVKNIFSLPFYPFLSTSTTDLIIRKLKN